MIRFSILVQNATALDTEFHRGLGLYDSTMVVVGSMIGSGIFIVSADMSRNIGSPGWLLVAWLLTGLLTVVGALSYGELAAMMPRAGGQYVYLREAFSPLWGFLYGWTLFLVIQTGTIAAVSVGFARYFGALWPWISDDRYLVPPIHISAGYALSLSTTQLVGILLIALLSWTNTRGLEYGRIIQNIFTTAKTGALIGLVVVVIALYLLANVAYLVTLPFAQIQHAPADRVATATLDAIFPGAGARIMAIGIMVSTFGCANGLILAGARAYYAMARDRLFFASA